MWEIKAHHWFLPYLAIAAFRTSSSVFYRVGLSATEENWTGCGRVTFQTPKQAL